MTQGIAAEQVQESTRTGIDPNRIIGEVNEEGEARR